MPLSVISLNVDSIVSTSRKNLFYDFIKQHQADVYLLQETKLDNTIKLFIPDYNILRCDVRRGFAGVAMLIKNGLQYRNVTMGRENINFISLQIKLNGSWHKLTSLYVLHRISNMNEAFGKLFSGQMPIFFGGDTNARHVDYGDISSNAYGRALHEFSSTNTIQIFHPPSPTCYRTEHGSYIDKFITYQFHLPLSNVITLPSFSDHSAISINIECSFDFTPVHLNSVRLFHLTNFDRLNGFIKQKFDEIHLPINESLDFNTIDRIAESIDSTFSDAIDKFVPRSKAKKQQFILSNYTRSLQKQSKCLQRKRFSLGTFAPHGYRTQLNREISQLRKQIHFSVNNDTAKFFGERYDSVQNARNSYAFIRRFTGHKSKASLNGGLYTDESKTSFISGDEQIAHSLGNLFAQNHLLTHNNESPHQISASLDNALIRNTPPIGFNNQIIPSIANSNELARINEFLPIHQRHMLTSCDEVIKIILSRPNKTSSGRDDMPYTVIKKFSTSIITFLTIFFNHCIAASHFPQIFKHAIITPIPKPGRDSSLITNYRPISQLSCIAKIYEKILVCRLNRELSNLNIFENQFGFLSGHSTEHALARLQSDISSGLNIGRITSILAIDLKAAFDVVWHGGLIHKMCKLGLNRLLIKNFQSLLANRDFRVRLNGVLSNSFKMPAGVPQGSVSGPPLFNMFIHDITQNQSLKCVQYADDTSYYATHSNPSLFQTIFIGHFNNLNKYFKDWKLLLNTGKTEFINILGQAGDTNKNLRKQADEMRITVSGHLVPHSKFIRLLGLHFQRNARFTEHISIRLKKARTAKLLLNRFFKRRAIPTNIKSNVYKLYLRPIITYASPVWCSIPLVSSHQMERLRIFERSALKTSTNSHRSIGSFKHINASIIYKRARCARIDKFMVIRSVKFFNQIAKLNSAKFNHIFKHRNGRYPSIDYMRKLHASGQLKLNDRLDHFNRRYNGQNGFVYSLNQ